MYYCPCCGKIVSNTLGENPCECCFCETIMIDMDISSDDYWEKVTNHTDEIYDQDIRDTLVKTSFLFNQEKYNAREYSEKHFGDTIKCAAHCPTCNSTNIQKIGIGNKVASGAILGIFAINHIGKTFKCKSCGYQW